VPEITKKECKSVEIRNANPKEEEKKWRKRKLDVR
jgi:hypothetical protein